MPPAANNAECNANPNGTMATANEQQQHQNHHHHPIQSGIPPWHSMAFITVLLSVTIPHLPTLDAIDELATVEVLTRRKFPEWVSLQSLAFIRLTIAAIALMLTFYLACINSGWDVYPNYKPNSKLRRVFIRLEGIGTLCPFTSWCWMILGMGFLSRGIVALAASEVVVAVAVDGEDWMENINMTMNKANIDRYILENRYLLRATFVLWELTGPFAILVSSVIKYAIWPEVVKGGKPHNLAGFRNQLQHNCNSIFSLLEVTLLGGIPVEFSHLSLATLVGIIYITFTWFMANWYFGNSQVGPQYIYWFMDTTLEKNATKALAALAFALTLFFGLFAFVIQTVLGGGNSSSSSSSSSISMNSSGDANLVLNVLFLVVGTFLVCRFKN